MHIKNQSRLSLFPGVQNAHANARLVSQTRIKMGTAIPRVTWEVPTNQATPIPQTRVVNNVKRIKELKEFGLFGFQ